MKSPKPDRSWEPPNAQDFRTWRIAAGMTQPDAARWLGVAERTIRGWEAGTSRVPVAAYRLLKIRAGYALPGPEWAGWALRKGGLWSPAGQQFRPESMGYLSLIFRMAETWKKDYDARRTARTEAGESGRFPGLRPPSGPGCPAPPNIDRAPSNDPCWQEEVEKALAGPLRGLWPPASGPPELANSNDSEKLNDLTG